ncbi:ATP-binding protein [Lentzea sp. NPDC003310]|uniref:ATP-binding protein n=1 Tax=Lentzea sp. NPDC003310 TaxID=3154447 RepID=UPI0033A3F3C8
MATSALTEAVFSLPETDRSGGVALARDFARRTVLTCGYRGSHEDVVLVVDELAADAVRHGGRPVVRLRAGTDRVRVEVVDDARSEPRAHRRLAAVLADRWGVVELAGQKVVWCELTA